MFYVIYEHIITNEKEELVNKITDDCAYNVIAGCFSQPNIGHLKSCLSIF